MAEIAVVHLVWEPAGIGALENFIRAYKAQPAGIAHDLIVAFNGFGGKGLEIHRQALNGIADGAMEIPDRVQDIPAYSWVARRVPHRHVCFVNSYSEPLVSGWLMMLHQAMMMPATGAVGATGSWESHYTNYELAVRAAVQRTPMGYAKGLVRRYRLARYRRYFDPAPNPHLRSNAFMIERAAWLEIATAPVVRKWDALRFEGGRESMTRRLESRGLNVRVVGRDGVAYQKDDWPNSFSFRSGGQANLLVADNRTRQYADASHEERRRLNTLAWGEGTAPL
jgi:hypothetical protein